MGGCQNHSSVCIFRSAAEGELCTLGLAAMLAWAVRERVCVFAARQCPGKEGQGRLFLLCGSLGMCQGCCLKGQQLKLKRGL